jgi:hypothetical protein
VQYEIDPPETAQEIAEIVDAPLRRAERRAEFTQGMLDAERSIVKFAAPTAAVVTIVSLCSPIFLTFAFVALMFALTAFAAFAWDATMLDVYRCRQRELEAVDVEERRRRSRPSVESRVAGDLLVRKITVGEVYWTETAQLDLNDEGSVAVAACWLADDEVVLAAILDGSYARPRGLYHDAVQALASVHATEQRQLSR